MDSIENPVGKGPRDPYEKYRVEGIEKEHREPPPQELEEPEGQGAGLGAYLLVMFRKFIELFEEAPEKGLSARTEKRVQENLLQLKKSFQTIKSEDLSQDSEFIAHLSQIWRTLLEDALRFKSGSLFSIKLKGLIKSIDSYPPQQLHTLSYYLTEYAGQKWLPFPFMEMIQKLHAQHQKNPSSSSLEQWTVQIQELALLLGPE